MFFPLCQLKRKISGFFWGGKVLIIFLCLSVLLFCSEEKTDQPINKEIQTYYLKSRVSNQELGDRPPKVCLLKGKRKGLSNFYKIVLANTIQKRERPYDYFKTKPNPTTSHRSEFTEKHNGIKTLLSIMLNSLMKAERKDFLTTSNSSIEMQNMIYTTNQIERLKKFFKRTLKIHNSMPSVDSVLTLMSKTAIDMGETAYRYPLSRFADSVLFN